MPIVCAGVTSLNSVQGLLGMFGGRLDPPSKLLTGFIDTIPIIFFWVFLIFKSKYDENFARA
tara:strand:- start:38 stop:223 length:186 start_codon:yes stop_codon:yes gene_type:complete